MIYNPVLAKGDSRAFKSFSVYLFEMIKITVGIIDSNRKALHNELEIDSRIPFSSQLLSHFICQQYILEISRI